MYRANTLLLKELFCIFLFNVRSVTHPVSIQSISLVNLPIYCPYFPLAYIHPAQVCENRKQIVFQNDALLFHDCDANWSFTLNNMISFLKNLSISRLIRFCINAQYVCHIQLNFTFEGNIPTNRQSLQL